MSQKFLFICGCPRSGTTALVKLLNSHKSIGIGMERYKNYADKNNIHKINNHAFTAQHFFDLKDEQTNIHWNYFYDNLKNKYEETVEFFGDKYPHYYRFYNQINENLMGNVKWVFIIRDIVDVANSYNSRAADPQDIWPEKANYERAVFHWNESLVKTWKYQKTNVYPNLFVCEYEKLFNYDLNYLVCLLDFLEVESDSNIKVCFEQMKTEWQRKQISKTERTNILKEYEFDYIKENANHALRDNIIKKFS